MPQSLLTFIVKGVNVCNEWLAKVFAAKYAIKEHFLHSILRHSVNSFITFHFVDGNLHRHAFRRFIDENASLCMCLE